MADEQPAVAEGSAGPPDPRLDFFSDTFDPLYALYAENVVVPMPKAKQYDNLHKYELAWKHVDCLQAKPSQPGSKLPEKKAEAESTAPEGPVRRWKDHQLPVSVPRPIRPKKNVLVFMETVQGPLALLQKCRQEQLTVKVFTRNATFVRGFCEGVVSAFDKHWNLALKDVTEVWTRKKRRKAPPLCGATPATNEKKGRLKAPSVDVISTKGKMETCRRIVPQLIIRGEQIVTISMVSA